MPMLIIRHKVSDLCCCSLKIFDGHKIIRPLPDFKSAYLFARPIIPTKLLFFRCAGHR